jgi:Sulfotransferase family
MLKLRPDQGSKPRLSHNYALIVGCPRSGTSWLQLLLSQHPQIATTKETHLFNGYLGRQWRAWEHYKSLRSGIGLTQLLSEEDFYQLCAAFAGSVFQRIADTKPGSSLVLEKTPDHVRFAPFILRLLPDAQFLHMIRDPRSVVTSLVSAARSWGRDWAQNSIVDNASLWRSDVRLGRQISALTHRYHEVRYEELMGNRGAETLERIFAWLGLPVELGFCQATLRTCSFERMRQNREEIRDYKSTNRTGTADWANIFPRPEILRKGRIDSWKEELSQTEIAMVEYLAGDLMQECGYSPSGVRIGVGIKLRLKTRAALDLAERQTRRMLDRAFRKARSVM